MSRDEKASLSLHKTLAICFIFILVLSVAVVAGNVELRSVRIQFSNNHEITVVTSRTKVSEILEANNIILASNEMTIPGLDEEISENNTIEIFIIGTRDTETVEISEASDENTVLSIVERHQNTEYKIVTVTEEIPYETITRDVTSGNNATENRVIQTGRNGLRETKYKITFVGETELSRIPLETTIVREPRDRIVQIQVRPVPTTRAATSLRAGTGEVAESGMFQITAYCICVRCTGSGRGITASGTTATAGRTIAAPPRFAFGTQIRINGNIYVVEDRGGAVQGNVLDIFVSSHEEALRWGRRHLYVEIIM